jgi:hypothetical protein
VHLEMITMEEYWTRVGKVFKELEKAFGSLKPAIVEFKISSESLLLRLGDDTPCGLILIAEPSARQLWLEVNGDGGDFHFYYDPISDSWLDAKGSGVELKGHIAGLLRTATGISISL